MSQGGTIAARLNAIKEKLDEEYSLWLMEDIEPNGWRFGNDELLARCEIDVLTQIISDKLGLSEDEMNLMLKERVLFRLQALRPMVFEQVKQVRAEAARRALTEGIFMRPTNPDNGGMPT